MMPEKIAASWQDEAARPPRPLADQMCSASASAQPSPGGSLLSLPCDSRRPRGLQASQSPKKQRTTTGPTRGTRATPAGPAKLRLKTKGPVHRAQITIAAQLSNTHTVKEMIMARRDFAANALRSGPSRKANETNQIVASRMHK
ncbi:unnamed protein product [Prorocentrum cordatum]|uniref:Uncharacterized protein n=1 Tax=Prorocentrum cordatum TaxID=2364126 RepID=A0ABN9Q4B8_9DINO|nr:unnamed protein product [Polarella glacialis]